MGSHDTGAGKQQRPQIRPPAYQVTRESLQAWVFPWLCLLALILSINPSCRGAEAHAKVPNVWDGLRPPKASLFDCLGQKLRTPPQNGPDIHHYSFGSQTTDFLIHILPLDLPAVLVTALLLWRNTMTKENFKINNLIRGLLMVPEDESVTIMAGNMAAVRCGPGVVARSSHLIYN